MLTLGNGPVAGQPVAGFPTFILSSIALRSLRTIKLLFQRRVITVR